LTSIVLPTMVGRPISSGFPCTRLKTLAYACAGTMCETTYGLLESSSSGTIVTPVKRLFSPRRAGPSWMREKRQMTSDGGRRHCGVDDRVRAAWTMLVSAKVGAMHARLLRPEPRRHFQSSAALFVTVALSLSLACGGATKGGTVDGEIDSGDVPDAGDPSDAAGMPDAGTHGDAGRPECDSTVVTCRSVPPSCPKGEVPVVAGTCWGGGCVKASTCRSVKDCTACTADTDVCAVDSARTSQVARCVEVPTVCVNDRTCNCLSSFVCTTRSFTSCGASSDREFQCTCPIC
jgi:hypothetical protein